MTRGQMIVGWLLLLSCQTAGAAQALVGQSAPDFTLTDTTGVPKTLSQLRGTIVVLEWFNPDCPFVKRHYGGGNMQRLQSAATEKGVIWLTIDSSAEGKQGYLTRQEAAAVRNDRGMRSTALLLDPDGRVGRLYGAKTTPHLFVIDAKGVLVYAGAIDPHPSVDPADLPPEKNYVTQALDELLAGKPVSVPQTTAYGCSVKY